MRTLLTKTALTAALGLAITFTLSCSDDKDDNNPVPPPTVSSSSGGSSSSGTSSSGSSSGGGEPAHTHVWGVWAVTDASTCEAAGVETRTCTLDQSHTETQEVAKLAWGEWEVTTSASSTTVGVETRACPGGASPAETRPLYPKCGSSNYDPSTQRCGSGNVVETKCGSGWYNALTQFCYESSKVGSFCGINPQKSYDPDLYECKSGKNGIYLKEELTDADGNNYDAVLIGAQTWMAENLNYDASDSKCYSNSEDKCNDYGRLYNWTTAMADVASSTANPSGVQGVCPDGWHLPSQAEWDALTAYIEGDKSCTSCNAKHLKVTSWNTMGVNGEDSYGFAALPGGRGGSDGKFSHDNTSGFWWSASESENNADYAYQLYMWDNALLSIGSKDDLFSVRCLQDQD